jgi:nucleotide-binding universal stress UspA family protein
VPRSASTADRTQVAPRAGRHEPRDGGTYYPAISADVNELGEAAEQSLERTVQETLSDTDSVEVEPRLVEGLSAGVLVNESRDADLLVVGSRGHGGFAELLLGSVSQQVAHHAACPVVIVHPKSTA